MIALANGLNLKVIAEGAETQEQLDFLIQYECNYIQGHLFEKPLSAQIMQDKLLQIKKLAVK
ncbi:MAG TPA: EAL domain-containing protein [Sulfurimonas sp.]|nr:EAL domain-containing protein [Sulfurimonas sp.]HIM75844.1 EAL domain-containing protein [Campylobacterales bacterium]